MRTYFLPFLCTAILAGCAGNAPVTMEQTDYDAAAQARIRLYGQNQKSTIMYSGIDCATNPQGDKVNVGGQLGDAFGSLVGSVASSSIGIAPSEISQNIGERNGIMSRAFFREFAIPAGKPVNVQAAYIGLETRSVSPSSTTILNEGSCNSNLASFVPEAGHDYEVVGLKGKQCGVAVYEVAQSGTLTPLPLDEAYRCNR